MADELPDARDGLTRLERAILVVLNELGGSAPTMQLYGRVLEKIDCSKGEFEAALQRLLGKAINRS
jgi:hypothetical protein